MTKQADALNQQIAYYRARAGEYDEWFYRTGRYDRGEEHREAWRAELAQVESALKEAKPGGRILELACGTGLWTQHLLPCADHLTVVDASPEMLDLCRERVGSRGVNFVQADLFEWQPAQTYDFVFFAFWLSHVPEERFCDFWARLAAAIEPEGRVFFVDSLLRRTPRPRTTNRLTAAGSSNESSMMDGDLRSSKRSWSRMPC